MASLNLQEMPYPLGNTEDDIKKDPKLCRTCWNLYGGSVYTAVGLAYVAMHEHSGSINAAKAAKAGNLDNAPAWAGISRIDYASWQIGVYVLDIPRSIAGGCPSCLLLQQALAKLTNGTFDCSNSKLWLDIIICKGNVLRVNLIRGSSPDKSDMLSFGVGAVGDFIESYEIYTLPGKISESRNLLLS